MNLQKIIDKALKVGFEDVEVVVSTSNEKTINLFNGEVEKNFIGNSCTYTVKGILNGKKAVFNFEDENVDCDFVVSKLYENVGVITTDESSSIFEGSEKYATLNKVDGGFKNVPTSDKIELLKTVYNTAKEYDSRLINFPYCEYIEAYDKREVVNSKGLNLSREIEYGGVILSAVAMENGQTQDGTELAIKLKYNELDAAKIANKACEKAISMLGAEPIESGFYDVIIENEAMTSLLSGFSSMFSGEAAIRRLTSLIGKENQKIMDEKISIIDDPLKENAINSETFDDDGVATYTKSVVENGVFKTFLHNLKTAQFFNIEVYTTNAITYCITSRFCIKELCSF